MKQSEAIRIHNEAVALAQKATAKYLEEYGDDYPCGFAGVKIKLKEKISEIKQEIMR